MSNNKYELIIIGLGPAGITASIYAARKKVNFLALGKSLGGQAVWSSEIQNYTGFQFISGVELMEKFKDHMEKFNVKINENEEASLVKKENGIIKVKTNKAEYEAKTVIISSGKMPRALNISGENEFKNKGVAYCATCDGPLFAGTDVAVVGGGNSALDAVLGMMKIASRVYLINRKSALDADAIMIEKAKTNEKVTILNDTEVVKIYGDDFVKGVKIKSKNDITELGVEGIFVEIGSVPSSFFAEGVEKNEKGEIIVNCLCETNIPGIFAAGDVTNVSAKQIIIACGEGAKASVGASEYLNTL